ncbi:MAG TPA: hypothetical protein VK175_18765 [Leadbetterella sp.]|nr:hypothetical protein [Leadbetterella sp.]
MKKTIFLLSLIANAVYSQSITISPSGSDNTLIQKQGDARLSIKGQPGNSLSGKSFLTMDSEPIGIGLANASSSSIEFNNNSVNKYSIKHNSYSSFNSNFQLQSFSWLSFNGGTNEIARIESDYMNIKKLGIGSPSYTNYPITFNSAYGDKISLNDKTCTSSIFGSCTSFDENHYGIGYQSNLFQIFSRNIDGDIAFGYGKSSALNENVRFKGNGNVGIGVSNPLEKLHVNGTIRSTDLAGTSIRTVKADANGSLTTEAQTKYLAIPNTSFIKISNDGTAASYFFGLSYLNSGTGSIKCTMNIPHNATVTNIRVYYLDNDATNDLTFYMEKTAHTGTSSFLTSMTSSSGSNSNIQFFDMTGFPLIVNNQLNSYKILITQKSGTAWSTFMGVSSIVVTYEE